MPRCTRRPQVVLLIGLQACGKTTFYRERLAATHALVSKDAMPRSARRKEDRQRRELAALLADGHDVCVDNTQPSAAERAGVIAVARAHGAWVVGYWWPPDLELSRRRNATRGDPVPEVGLYAALARWQEPRPDEGFDQLSIARWVPQAEVLARASAVDCHGGSGTTLGALAGGVPW